MYPEKKKPARAGAVLRAYGTAVFKYPGLLWGAVLATVLIEAAEVTAPLFLRQFVNVLAGGSSSPNVVEAIIWILIAYALVNLAAWAGQRLRMFTLGRVEARTMADLYDNAFTYLIGHSHEFFISNFTGTLTRRVTRYARSFESVLDNLLMNFVPAALFVIGVVIVLSLSSIWLGMSLLVLTAIFIYVQYRMMMYIQPLRTRRTEEDSHMTGALSDAVLNHSTIVTYAASGYERSYFGKVTDVWRAATSNAMDAYAWIYGILGLAALLIEIGLLGGTAFYGQKDC